MASHTTALLLTVFVLAFCLTNNGVHAFGAGNIPSFSYLEGKAFRHGDIEDVIAEIAKGAGGALGGGLAFVGMKSKFGGLDVKRIYFGNWLRDYSQAVDIATLKQLQVQTIINLCMALGFLAHGYATNEFEVTEERLGTYLPTEHIDNPKGYGDGEDPRKYHPKLRGPVDPVELEIDPRTGMKNYIANENGHWDTSKALVRRTLEQCIHLGRRNKNSANKADEYEALRLLGQALHTLEDFPAHSNFCELALVSMGHQQVFTHVGDSVRIQAPNGKRVAPLITGTFGSDDFIHSLLGEASDHLASISDLNKELDKARSRSAGPGGPQNAGDVLRELLFKLPGGSGSEMSRDMEGIERIRAGPAQGGKRPEDMSPQELHAVLWQVLTFRDGVVKKISKTIEKIPGLGPLIEKLMDSISIFVFTTLEPYLKPILKSASSGLTNCSAEVIDSHDQYEVFNDPRASDPTHSFLSKDHFNLILNETGGNLAMIIVRHTVTAVVKAWSDTSADVGRVTSDILDCLFHPDFQNSNSKIQHEMMQYMSDWFKGLGSKQSSVLQRLEKESVRNHKNVRLAGEGGAPDAHGTFAHTQGTQFQQNIQSTVSGYLNQVPGVSQAQSMFGGGGGNKREFSGDTPGSHQPPSGPPPASGEAASFFAGPGGSSAPPSSDSTGYAAPSGPPPPQHAGYSPSYSAPNYPPAQSTYPGGPGSHGGPPSFPSPGGPSFPGHGSPAPGMPHAQPPYGAPPGAPPNFPGAHHYPSAPGFPGAQQYPHYPPPGGFR
ncbi:heterokaryon incompatibility protein Het-C-domain-containing protein [Pterulicium gracile]|uniref:Heterokaryon incompatibility protein Het-C-domain-containing protein n=1 Tax=Pterulicium gracile TaxID=1884261 RepID=A0A5C3QHV9_9AGAR|nr:heterokaryon incompatibility protein Het-C-domain-containing protein [Pterula gracilis]